MNNSLETAAPANWCLTLKLEPERELHPSGIGLDIGDSSKLTAKLVNEIRAAVRIRRQTPSTIGDAEIHVVKGIVDVPAECEEAAFRQIKALGKRHIHVPVTWCASTGGPDGCITE